MERDDGTQDADNRKSSEVGSVRCSSETQPRELPSDLPRSLDDRKNYNNVAQETEYYDAWQGQSQFLTAPTFANPLHFNLSLNEADEDAHDGFDNDDARMAEMFAQRTRTQEVDRGEQLEDDVLQDDQLSREQKEQSLQDFLFMAASNGDAKRVHRLVRGSASDYIKIDAVDSEGTPPLIYAACFGHKEVVLTLLDAGAVVDSQDRNQWTALMWAMTNRHKDIAKVLLDHGASTDVKSSSGRTALDFVPPNSDMSDFLHHEGFDIGDGPVTDDFYNSGFSQDRFEEELAENEMRRRMMMESAINLEVDIGNLGIDEQPEEQDELEDGSAFVWERCLNDQMFVFMENDVARILDIVVTNMTPQRSATQKPVPANVVFLGARYAHYHASVELLSTWLETAHDKILAVVDRHQWDMTILAFWISNATLLLYYLKKDHSLAQVTPKFQGQMAELIHETYILIIRDAERRMDKVLDTAILDHETIPGFEDITFQNEWRFLRSKPKVVQEPTEKRFRPPSPKRKARVSPRNITSLLSSTIFVLDLYDVHSIITSQILSQLYYWLGAETFNRTMSNKKYLARTKAMQIRMNISTLEDWAKANNRKPEQYENGALTSSGQSTVDAARKYLAPTVQLLQWLQCFSSLGEERDAMESTIEQLPALSTKQLQQAVKHYRAEVGEKTLSKAALKSIAEIKASLKRSSTLQQAPQTPVRGDGNKTQAPVPGTPQSIDSTSDTPDEPLMNAALLLPFHLPTSTDMLVSYGRGFGGMDREQERRYTPSVPQEVLSKLDFGGGQDNDHDRLYEGADLSDGSG